MRVESHLSRVPGDAAAALEEFEREFTYPLGTGCRFRISHGEDYLGFFRAMGEATLVTVSGGGKIAGSLARVRRHLVLRTAPDAEARTSPCHYLGDLKVRAECRGGTVLARLFRETKHQILASDTHACYGVVMGGTGRLPTDYTGRVGVPGFENLGGITILRLASGDAGGGAAACRRVDADEMLAVVDRVAMAGYQCGTADRRGRSLMEPVHLVAGEGDACATLEDTRRVKRLFVDSGEELVSAHLGSFRYRSEEAAGSLLGAVVAMARESGYPAVFCAVPEGRMKTLRPWLTGLEVTEAPATVYGVGMQRGMEWWMDTAEI